MVFPDGTADGKEPGCSGQIVFALHNAIERVQSQRHSVGHPIKNIRIGTQPPLEFYEEHILAIEKQFGSGADVGARMLSFDWSPFRECASYSGHCRSTDLSPASPNLWTDDV